MRKKSVDFRILYKKDNKGDIYSLENFLIKKGFNVERKVFNKRLKECIDDANDLRVRKVVLPKDKGYKIIDIENNNCINVNKNSIKEFNKILNSFVVPVH
ncbi:MAG: hypothetical protein FH753_17580 [Firmicutes bacterium]|nr:hypothetical protein [Bacillota bacterium]